MKCRKKFHLAWLILTAVLLTWTGLISAGTVAEDDLETVRVGVVYDGNWDLLDSLVAAVEMELDLLVEGEYRVEYPADLQLNGEWDLLKIDAHFRTLLADDRVDFVITAGLAASQIACLGRDGYAKPVIAPLSLDFEIQDLPRDGVGSGVHNLTYVGMPSTLRRELEVFQELIPFDNVVLIANREVLESMPEIEGRTLARLEGMDLSASYIAAERTADATLAKLSPETDVVYLWPLLMDSGELQKLIDGLNARRLPSFSWLGKQEVELGAFATLSPDAGRNRLARRVALDIQQILLGTPAAEIEVDFIGSERLILNLTTMRQINVWPRFEALLEAEIVGDWKQQGLPEVALFGAVHRAVEANRSLEAERMTVRASLEDIAASKALLRPTVDATLSQVRIDDDRAAAAAGTAPENTTLGSIEARQLVYSDGALGGVKIQKELQRSREATLEQAMLDVALDASIAYLNLLRAETQVQVRRSNVDLTRTNLELAQSRRRIGTAAAAEVYRWESQIALDRRNLVDADAEARSALVVLNRLLHEPLDREIRTVDVTTDDPRFSPGSGLMDGYIETPLHFKTLMEFAVTEALEKAPEIRSIEAAIVAQERAVKVARRSNRVPTIAARATVDEMLDGYGAGSGPLPPGSPNDTDWSLALSATLPLYSGGEKRAERRKAELELDELRLQREAIVEGVETSIRTAMLAARASFTSIGLADASAQAASKNLELVQDAYARGAVSIIDLIDAQNSSLAADLAANDAVYNFFIDLMQVQRASNRFDFFTSPGEREDWVRRAGEFFESRGVKPWGKP